MSFMKKSAKFQRKNPGEVSFGEVVGLQRANLLKWNPAMSGFLGLCEITFWCIFQNGYYMESLQIIGE